MSKGHFAADIKEGLTATDGIARKENTLNKLMGIALHKEAVFVGAGFGFIAIDYEVTRPHILGSETPLHTGRETGAAASKKSCGLDLVGNCGRTHRKCFTQRLITTGGFVTSKRVAIGPIETRGDDSRSIGNHFSPSPAAATQTGITVSSGVTLPARRSAGMC